MAPLRFGAVIRSEVPAQDLSLVFKLRQRGFDQRRRQLQTLGKLRSAIRSAGFEPAAQNLGSATLFGFGNAAWRQEAFDGRGERGFRMHGSRDETALGRRPERLPS